MGNTSQAGPTYVELFCGCGGLSLGLESAGFHRLLANDVSPMAGETFAYNLVEGAREALPPSPENLDSEYFDFLVKPASKPKKLSEKSYRDWSSYRKTMRNLNPRAIENITRGTGPGLVIGRAELLEKVLKKHPAPHLKGIDLLAGGPPCQSFSLAGKRQKDHPRNQLFKAFASIAGALQPKVVLLENVLGITAPFRDENGQSFHPWFEVCKAFRQIGYVPVPSLINTALLGIPQSRVRFILVALQESIASRWVDRHDGDGPVSRAIIRGQKNYGHKSSWERGDDQRLIHRLLYPADDEEHWPVGLFPEINTDSSCNLEDAISDLGCFNKPQYELDFSPSGYSQRLTKLLPPPGEAMATGSPGNLRSRKHGDKTRARFRLMRMLNQAGWRAKSMREVLKDRDRAYQLLKERGSKLLDIEGKEFKASSYNKKKILALLSALESAKHAQRCLDKDAPAPSQLSIPDDFIHWNADQVLTIREMARIQSFPDWFEFKSKETTGGSSRAFEVPQYTQIGNAVPPLLGLALGESIRSFLEELATP